MEKIWINSYSSGVPAEIDVSAYDSLGDYFDHAVAQFADRTAFISGSTGVAITYRQLEQYSRNLAAYFQSVLGLPKGARVALMMPNILQYPICLYGLLRAGYVVVNVNPMYTARELEHQLRDSGAQAMVVVELFAHILEKVIANTSLSKVVVTGLADMMPFPKRVMGNFIIRRIKKMIPDYTLPGSISFLDMLGAGAASSFSPVKMQRQDIAFLQYTGGTTGVSKGAMLSHLNILANVKQTQVWSDPFIDKNEQLTSITAIPLYHIFALTASLGFIAMGGSNVLVADPRNIPGFVSVLAKYPFASLPAVNTLFNGLLNDAGFAKVDFSRLRFALGGGAAVQRSVAERWQNVTGAPLIEAYGLTECSPAVSMNPLCLGVYNGSIGLPLPSTEVSIRNEAGEELPLGAAGELCVKGPQVMAGYWNLPKETAAVMTNDGFLRTGDVAQMDEKGFLKLVDRLKDMILVSGFNVYPNEIEEVVMMHADVLEVAAVGKFDAGSGEAVKIFVVKKNATLTEESLLKHCRENLTGYKMPRQVVFLDDLPKSNVGKILRRDLRELHAS
ncbi:AMP-binding protein [Undibacterium parvum]|uniref:Long-chain-fatty-acid--CoA ligase n=1 Tax=Undibacterium parvum TaxID=401471 RepID=A0A3Q9BSW7_9BURK|nr:AMP-binding protein [Undibacterium parvum]AZP13501.1 long-chain-fatty-acid--CoA ligase [Undibacterium parvum]